MSSKRQIFVGGVPIGGGAPVVVQTMCKTETANVEATMEQIRTVADAGAAPGRRAGPRGKGAQGAEKATKANVPMRIGVNSGSLPKHLHDLERGKPVEALVQAAVEFVELMERLDFENFKVSIKSTNVPNTIASNRMLAEKIPSPTHLGITEAGTRRW